LHLTFAQNRNLPHAIINCVLMKFATARFAD